MNVRWRRKPVGRLTVFPDERKRQRLSPYHTLDAEVRVWKKEDVAGHKFLGGYYGGSEYLGEMAAKQVERGKGMLTRLQKSSLSHNDQLKLIHGFPSRFSYLAGVNGAGIEFQEAFGQLDLMMVDYLQNLSAVNGEEWTAVQQILVRTPLKQLGLGIRSVEEFGPIKFLCGFAALLNYIQLAGMSERALLSRGILDVWHDPAESSYGRKLRDSMVYFQDLFERINHRRLSLAEDGCDFEDLDNFPSANKLANVGRELIDAGQKVELEEQLDPVRLEFYRAMKGATHGGIDWFTALGQSIPDNVVNTLLRNRLLVLSPGGFQKGDKCPGKPACRLGGDVLDPHAMGCIHIGPKGDNSFLHETLRKNIFALLRFSGVPFDTQDASNHVGLVRRLRVSGQILPVVAGRKKGGDILALNVMGPPGILNAKLEMVLDGTVTSKLGTSENPFATLAKAESEKLKYAAMYDRINVGMEGLAMDVYGHVGPNLLKLIKKCDAHRGDLGRDHLPAWANWKCNTFERAWLTKFVVSIQVAAASKLNFAKAAVTRIRFDGG